MLFRTGEENSKRAIQWLDIPLHSSDSERDFYLSSFLINTNGKNIFALNIREGLSYLLTNAGEIIDSIQGTYTCLEKPNFAVYQDQNGQTKYRVFEVDGKLITDDIALSQISYNNGVIFGSIGKKSEWMIIKDGTEKTANLQEYDQIFLIRDDRIKVRSVEGKYGF